MNRPAGMRPLLTGCNCLCNPKYRWNDEVLPLTRPFTYHAGRTVYAFNGSGTVRPVWKDAYGAYRIAHTDDMIRMLEDIGIETRAF